MKQQYESEILFHLMERDGFNIPSSVPPYEAEIKAYLINQVKQAYPKLTDYEAEWLLYNYTKHLPADFPISSVTNVTKATFENVVPFAYKSAILKGNTLVNAINYDTGTSMTGVNLVKDDDTITVTSQNAAGWLRAYYSLNVSYDKTYIVTWDSLTYTHTDSRGEYQLIGVYGYDENGGQYTVKVTTQNQTNKYLIFTIPSSSNINISRVQIRIHATAGVAEAGVTTTIKGLKIIEYQEGMENWNIPYFEGMQSVKMPVLTTTGKNLINMNDYALSDDVSITQQNENSITFNAPYTWGGLQYRMQLNPNTKYTVSMDRGENTIVQLYVRLKNENGNYSGANGGGNKCSFTTNNTGFVLITIETSLPNQTNLHISNLQLEEGSTATPYEPYKTNILITSEEVTLRGIGEVKDELDCLTGEIVERIGEVVLNGSENIDLRNETLENTLLFITRLTNINIKSNLIYSDKFDGTDISWDAIMNTDKEFIRLYTNDKNALYIRILKSKLATQDVNGFKQWLSKNPITIQYKLATESIKTVDLKTVNESGESIYFMPLEGTMHIHSNGSPLKPTITMEIPVEATTQNLASFIDLEAEE